MNGISFWDGLTEEEKKIAMEAVNSFQAEKLKRERINALKDEVFNGIETLYNLMSAGEWDYFIDDLNNNFPM